MRALLSVSDKTGLVEFASGLAALGCTLISTGGTSKVLQAAGLKTIDISKVTGFPEMLDGRVKTLHPKIHGGLLALRENPEHMQTIKEHEIETIDIVVVNLYPFAATVAKPNVHLHEAIENIDIGGPSMLRSAAKNYQSVTVICDPQDYAKVLSELQQNQNQVSFETKQNLAIKVFGHTASYDACIHNYLTSQNKNSAHLPNPLILSFEQTQALRYGENPHQKAAYYGTPYKQLHGKELSFNNIVDMDAAMAIVAEFEEPATAIVKHNNPCGAALGDTLSQSYDRALACDSTSAFGGIVAVNQELDEHTAQSISKIFYEIVIAPSFSPKALEILQKKKDLRLIQRSFEAQGFDYKRTAGGFLVQDRDQFPIHPENFKTVTKKSIKHVSELLFAWKICKHVKSNAIVITKDMATVGIGAGQMSRIDSLKIAIEKAKAMGKNQDSVLASDAFFPFKDCVELAAQNGISEIIQPGGSIRDQESIDAANTHHLAMVFTGIRHFKH